MNHRLILSCVLVSVGGLLWGDASAPRPAAADEGEIAGVEWLTDLDAARAEAATSGRPLLVVFR